MRRLTAPAGCLETVDHHASPTAIVAPKRTWRPLAAIAGAAASCLGCSCTLAHRPSLYIARCIAQLSMLIPGTYVYS